MAFASFLSGTQPRLTFSLEAVTQGMWSHVWLRTGDGWSLASVLYHIGTSANEEIGYYWNLSEMKRQPLWEELEWPQSISKSCWERLAWWAPCGCIPVLWGQTCDALKWQQWALPAAVEEMMESGKTAEWEIRRSTLRRHRDSNSVTRPDGWPNLLADGPAEK